MKSLRRIGSVGRRARLLEVAERAAEVRALGQDRERRGAAALVGLRDLGDGRAGADLARRRRAALVLGDDRRRRGARAPRRTGGPRGAARSRASRSASGTSLAAAADLVARDVDDALQDVAHAAIGASSPLMRTYSSSVRGGGARRDRLACALDARRAGRRRARSVDRRARVEQDEVRVGPALAGEDRARDRGVVGRVAAAEIGVGRGLGRPTSAAADVVAAQLVAVDLHDVRGGGRAHLVQAIRGGDYQRAVAAQAGQRAGEHLEVAGSETPTTWRARAGRVGQRAEEVEDRADGQLLARRDHLARGGVVARART